MRNNNKEKNFRSHFSATLLISSIVFEFIESVAIAIANENEKNILRIINNVKIVNL